MLDAGRRATRLSTAGLGAFAFFFLVLVQLPLFFGRFPRPPLMIDFANYMAAARVGLRHGWNLIYDRSLQGPEYLSLTGAGTFEWHQTFLSPPPAAWLVAPLALLPLTPAFWIWTAVSAVVFLGACWSVLPWRGVEGITALVVGAGCFPVLLAFQWGQVTPLIAAACAFALVALRAGRPVLAGLLLVSILVKPQVGIVVPLALLLAGHRRAFAAWLAGGAVLVAVSVASLGVSGVEDYLADARLVQSHSDNQIWTLAWFTDQRAPTAAIELACAAVGLLVAVFARGRDPGAVFVAATLGSLLGAGYHHAMDFPVLLPLALLQMRLLPAPGAAAFAVLGVAISLVTPHFGPGPLLAFCVGWLALVATLLAAGRVGSAEVADVKVVKAEWHRNDRVAEEPIQKAR